jgi:hypothetical protein
MAKVKNAKVNVMEQIQEDACKEWVAMLTARKLKGIIEDAGFSLVSVQEGSGTAKSFI